MRIEDRRLFTYPVLAAGRDDYKTCKFSAELKSSVDAANNLVFDVKFSTNCAEIRRLIANGDAEYFLHMECPTTIYRNGFGRAVENFSCKIPMSLVKEKLYLAAFITLRRDIENFSCKDWNEDFGGLTFNLQKGSVLAYKNFPPFVIAEDPNIFKNVGSIFSVYKKLGDDNTPFEVELTTQKIRIGLNEKNYALYRRYCKNPTLQPILNSMIILPVLVSVFCELKHDDTQVHTEDAWVVSLRTAYRQKKLNFDTLLEEEDSLTLAQAVMGLPITATLESIAVIFDDATEDS